MEFVPGPRGTPSMMESLGRCSNLSPGSDRSSKLDLIAAIRRFSVQNRACVIDYWQTARTIAVTVLRSTATSLTVATKIERA